MIRFGWGLLHPLSIFYPRFLDKANFGGGQKVRRWKIMGAQMGAVDENKHSNKKIKGDRQYD